MVKITTKIITRNLDIKDTDLALFQEVSLDTENNGTTLQNTLTQVKYIEEQADFHKKQIEVVVIYIGHHKVLVRSSRELNLVIEALHGYAWSLANDI